MLSYQHSYHAGNFADVQKHVTLLLLLDALAAKANPFFVLDAFAGRGGYDLQSPEAMKTAEYASGIGLIRQLDDVPELLNPYLDAVAAFNGSLELIRYPGSPWLIRHRLRSQDRMICCELHPQEFVALQHEIGNSKGIRCQHIDALQAVRSLLPPAERRGLLLLDPSYEEKQEYARIVQAVIDRYKHWREGIYAIWYPVLKAGQHQQMLDDLKKSGIRKILYAQITIDTDSDRMQGSGMIVINPPWKLKEQLELVTPWLWQSMSRDGSGDYRIEWLVPE